MEGELEPLVSEAALGEAEVRAVFGSGTRKAAGCMVTDGSLRHDCLIKVGWLCGLCKCLNSGSGACRCVCIPVGAWSAGQVACQAQQQPC